MAGIGRHWRRIVSSGLCGPVAGTLVSLLLLYHVSTAQAVGVPPGAYGPLSWPLFALILLAAGMGLLCAFRARELLRRGSAPFDADRQPAPGTARVVLAIGLIALYGAAFVYAGFLFATLAFLAAWLAFTHYRRPLALTLVSVLGTLAPLYLLTKVVHMPLPRGVGVLELATIQLYQWLRLF